MKHDRLHTRKMRIKHILRKKNIISNYPAFRDEPYYKCDGMYSKGKIHCSCFMCHPRSPKITDIRKMQSLKYSMSDVA